MAGNAPGSGFKATMTNELLIGEIKKVAKHDPALAQWLSAAVGGVVNKLTNNDSQSGAAVSSYGTKWNDYGSALVIPEYRRSIINDTRIFNLPLGEGYGQDFSINTEGLKSSQSVGIMMFHADGGNPVFEVHSQSFGGGKSLPFSIKNTRVWLEDANGYKVVDPNIIIQELTGSSWSLDISALIAYSYSGKTSGGYTLNVWGVDPSAQVSLTSSDVTFVGYQNQL